MQVYEYDLNLAEQLVDPESDPAGQDELEQVVEGLSPTSILSRGREFNEFMVNYQEVFYNYNDETGQVDTTYGDIRRYNSRQKFLFQTDCYGKRRVELVSQLNVDHYGVRKFGSGEVKHWRARQA